MSAPSLKASIVIPTYERRAQLARCLEALTHLEDIEASEVIVVDDGSSQSPQAVVDQFRDKIDVRLIVQPHAGVAAARNAGAAAARGKYLLFTADDCLPSSGWLRAMTSCLDQEPEGAAVGGLIRNGCAGNAFSEASQVLVEYMCLDHGGAARQRFFTPNNLAASAELFSAVGGFDPDFSTSAGEDRDFCARWTEHGFPLRYQPQSQVDHHHPLSWSTFLSTHWNYGLGSARFRVRQAARRTSRMDFEHPGYYLRLLLYPIRKRGVRALPLSFLLALSQAATAGGFVSELFRARANRSSARRSAGTTG